jgi:acyl-CoA synthetase (AMP-forming)/AMP-acid ligase II
VQLTLGRWLRDRAVVTPERTAIEFDDRSLSYANLVEHATSAATALTDHGLERGSPSG